MGLDISKSRGRGTELRTILTSVGSFQLLFLHLSSVIFTSVYVLGAESRVGGFSGYNHRGTAEAKLY